MLSPCGAWAIASNASSERERPRWLAARRLDGARAPTLRGIRRSVKEVWRVLAKCHEIRNRGEYEGDLAVTERPVTDLIDACSTVAHTLDTLASH